MHPAIQRPRVDPISVVLLIAFFVSGFDALVFQTIWQRMLTLFAGSDVVSATIVVSAFMAGLGFGNLAGGYLADRIQSRMRLATFAACELAVAAFAAVSATVYYDLLYTRLGSWALSRPTMVTVIFVVTLWPTFFMGMSLPLAAKTLTDDTQQPARWIPLLYGWNTIGAACGSIVAVTILFHTMDLRSSLRLGASLSFACGIGALAAMPLLFRRRDAIADVETLALATHAPTAAPMQLGLGVWASIYALSGFIALSLEILWFRVLGVVHKSNSITFGHLLAVYLGGVGVGALLANTPRVRKWRPAAAFFLLQAAIPLYAAFALTVLVALVAHTPALSPLSDYLAGSEPLARNDIRGNVGVFLAVYVGIPLWLIGPPTVLMGMTFGLLQRAVQTDVRVLGRRLGWLQTANITGSMLGALGTGLVLMRSFGSVGTLRILVGAGAVFLFLYVRTSHARNRWRLLAAALAVGAILITMPTAPALWACLHGTTPNVALSAEDGSGVSMIKPPPASGASEMAYANGLGQGTLPYGNIHTALSAFPLMLHPNPEAIAIIGLGSGDTSFSAGGRRETRVIDSIEIVAAELDTLQALSENSGYRALRMLLHDARVNHVFTDGRAYLRRTDRRYDIIEADALRPHSAYSGNLYSVEYFQLLIDRLKPGGFAVSWVPTDRVLETMILVFPHVRVFSGIAIGSGTPILPDRFIVQQRVQDPFTHDYYAAAGVNIDHLVASYFDGESSTYGPDFVRSTLTDVNHDLFPKDEFAIPRTRVSAAVSPSSRQ
jgi:spermidine synthase/MFS family permease